MKDNKKLGSSSSKFSYTLNQPEKGIDGLKEKRGALAGRKPQNPSDQEKIMEVFSQYRGIFSYRRMTVWLRKTMKKSINHKRIYRLKDLPFGRSFPSHNSFS
ncbi:transposase [Domibacillus indicus]|uniref:transposase n=1 Tax=Domibacillus indicus TaxID=1437523 RepID=UPI00203E6154|nr:transposase [Domibacillus indicus]MCM3791498.1 transposase [Domibacillus indicus]